MNGSASKHIGVAVLPKPGNNVEFLAADYLHEVDWEFLTFLCAYAQKCSRRPDILASDCQIPLAAIYPMIQGFRSKENIVLSLERLVRVRVALTHSPDADRRAKGSRTGGLFEFYGLEVAEETGATILKYRLTPAYPLILQKLSPAH